MAKQSTKTTAREGETTAVAEQTSQADAEKTAVVSRIDTTSLNAKALATVILAGQIRPRVGEIRRLAEAVLQKKKKKVKKASKRADEPQRKLSKIPARKAKKGD